MDIKKTINNILNVVWSLLLGGAILYWMYRGFDFKQVEDVLVHKMDWTWMLLSFPFGILAQMFRGWRWKQTLNPLDEHPRSSVSINSIFLSYALSLVVPRIGEFARCGVLKRWDSISFPKALGTVVTERVIDSLLVLIIAIAVFLLQIPVFLNFFAKTGTSVDSILHQFTATGYIVTAICGVAVLILNLMCGLVTFIVGSIAVIVPTPNGAGPWHFAVKTMLILYGIQSTDALFFVLIVHSVQTLLVILLGIYAWISLAFTKKVKSEENSNASMAQA